MYHSSIHPFNYPDLTRYPYWAFDTETTGLAYPTDRAFGLSIAAPDGQTWYTDLRLHPGVAQWFEDQLLGSTTVIGFNTQFDVKMLRAAGFNFPVTAAFDDAMIRACLIDEHLSTVFPWPTRSCRYSLEDLAQRYLGEGKDESIYVRMAELFGGPATRSAQIGQLWKAPAEVVAPYAMRDALVTLRLWEWQEQEIVEQGIQSICDFERRTMPTVVRAAMRGVPVDPDRADHAMDGLTVEINKQQAALNQLVGFEVNVNSSPQVRKLFNPRQTSGGWMADNGTMLESTSKGEPSVDHAALMAMEGDPRAHLIDDIRSLIKTRDTFLGKYIRDGSVGGVVYPNINQTAGEEGGTRTGRFSYSDPALQQIPSRNKRAASLVKSCFIAPAGMRWVDADMASYEVRIFAHLVAAYNDAVAGAYRENPALDLHQWVADLMGVPRNPTLEGGANAKQLNLSMIFNSGRGAIAEKIGMPWEWSEFVNEEGNTIRYRQPGPEAVAVIDLYHEKVPGVKELADRMQQAARVRGYVETAHGRRLRFPRGFKAYKASGLLIQATAADYNKRNWTVIEDALGAAGHLLLNTHDSYSMAIEEDGWEDNWRIVKEAVEDTDLRVPLLLELSGSGRTWWEAVSK